MDNNRFNPAMVKCGKMAVGLWIRMRPWTWWYAMLDSDGPGVNGPNNWDSLSVLKLEAWSSPSFRLDQCELELLGDVTGTTRSQSQLKAHSPSLAYFWKQPSRQSCNPISLLETVPMEIIILIIDSVAGDESEEVPMKALKACSQTCKTFLPMCQRHIFRFINLQDNGYILIPSAGQRTPWSIDLPNLSLITQLLQISSKTFPTKFKPHTS